MKENFFKEEIKEINPENSLYPSLLKRIENPPKTIYFRGELFKNENYFSIVGTRRCSDYGKEIAFSFAKELSKAGLTIVSGMARGIDSFSHKGAIEGAGITVAVLATGLDQKSIYPQENLKLAKKILESEGCLISEYPEGIEGAKFRFLERNRIISGMSIGVLIVEAKIKSGALNTAFWAKNQGKKIFAIPGSIFSQNSKGTHLLIKNNAKLVDSPNDVLKELGISRKEKVAQNFEIKNKEENLIFLALKDGSLPIDKIIDKTKLPVNIAARTLGLMEMEGRVKNLGGNVYTLNF